MVQKRRRVLWAKAHLIWTVSKWKSVLWSGESKFDILVGNHRLHVLRAKEEGLLSAFSSKASISDGMGVHKCIRYGQLACFGRHYECWKVYKVLEQHMLPSRRRLFQGRPCVFQQDNAKPHTAAITTAWLRSRRVQVLQSRSKNTSKTTTNSSAAGNLYQARMGPNSNSKTPETHNLDAQTSSNCFEKKRRCYTMVNMPPSQLFIYCSRHHIWNELILYIQFLSLNMCYVIYVLLWIKYWLMWFEILLVFILFTLKKNVPTFPEFGLYYCSRSI